MTRRAARAALLADLDRQARRTGSAASLHGKAIAERAGLNVTDYECVDLLDWTGPITAGELARRIGLTTGAVTGVIDRLEQAGLLERRSDPDDRRRVIVQLASDMSSWGVEMAALFEPLARDMHALNSRFDDDQLAAIVEWLREANDIVECSTWRLRGQVRPSPRGTE